MAGGTALAPPAAAPAAGRDAGGELLRIVHELAAEIRPGAGAPRVGLDTALERDLGLDSLARTELFRRVEQAFGAHLPEALLATAETPRDLLRALATAPCPPAR